MRSEIGNTKKKKNNYNNKNKKEERELGVRIEGLVGGGGMNLPRTGG